jgi:hypothetical protein
MGNQADGSEGGSSLLWLSVVKPLITRSGIRFRYVLGKKFAAGRSHSSESVTGHTAGGGAQWMPYVHETAMRLTVQTAQAGWYHELSLSDEAADRQQPQCGGCGVSGTHMGTSAGCRSEGLSSPGHKCSGGTD